MAEVTVLLRRWSEGDEQALTELTPIVYGELRRLARSLLAREGQHSTLQGTALVHEAYMRLVAGDGPNLQDRVHFFSVAARVMRRILIDHARKRQADKRGGPGKVHVPLDQAGSEPDAANFDIDWKVLDQALEQLAQLDPRRAKVVEMRFFGGFTDAEIAGMLGISEPTVRRDWVVARTFLFRRVNGE